MREDNRKDYIKIILDVGKGEYVCNVKQRTILATLFW